ncbi:MAG: rod shape-determining protein MreC [Terrimicrobiaceae bacterium]|nr:rod shape-determining protein MreC [Terrimicrobiaceae bacterium]
MFLSLFSPFAKTGAAVSEQLGSVGQNLKSLDQLERENRELILKNRELMATNQLLRDIEAENNKLRAALGYRERSVFYLLPARVISRDASTWWSTLKINRGFEDGVESDMPVVTEAGLVGKTTTVSKNESIVVLVTDETCRVAARVEGTVEQGIASGLRVPTGAASMEIQLSFLSKTANLQPGQKVYTAGISGGVFPSGILIGTVESFRARALDGQAILAPAVDLAAVEDVFVIVGIK